MGDIPVFDSVHKATNTHHAVQKMSYYRKQQIDSSPITRGTDRLAKGSISLSGFHTQHAVRK